MSNNGSWAPRDESVVHSVLGDVCTELLPHVRYLIQEPTERGQVENVFCPLCFLHANVSHRKKTMTKGNYYIDNVWPYYLLKGHTFLARPWYSLKTMHAPGPSK